MCLKNKVARIIGSNKMCRILGVAEGNQWALVKDRYNRGFTVNMADLYIEKVVQMTKKEIIKVIKKVDRVLRKTVFSDDAYYAKEEALAIITDSGVLNESH